MFQVWLCPKLHCYNEETVFILLCKGVSQTVESAKRTGWVKRTIEPFLN